MSNLSFIVPCAGSHRLDMALSTLSALLCNLRNTTVFLTLNEPQVDDKYQSRVYDVASMGHLLGNSLVVLCYPTEFSKSAMMMHVVNTHISTDYLVNVDDDVIVPASTLRLLESASEKEFLRRRAADSVSVFIYGLMDVSNKRCHIDYESSVVLATTDSIKQLIDAWGKKILPHRVYEEVQGLQTVELEPDTFLMHAAVDLKRNHGAGSWMIHAGHLLRNPRLGKILASWDKRMKGEDVFLVKNLASFRGMKWIVGSNAFHLDWNGTELDNPTWGNHLPFDDELLATTFLGE